MNGMTEGYFSAATGRRESSPKADLACAPVRSAWLITTLREEWDHVKYGDE